MKLYYSPGACSLSPHIILEEGAFNYETERVDLASGTTENGANFRTLNPKGYVPALLLDNGELLTEGPAIVQYLADRVPEKRLTPQAGSIEHYRLIEWLNFISTELHKGFSPLFNQNTPAEWKDIVKAQLAKRFDYVSTQIEGRDWLLGGDFSVADAYLFTVLGWGKYAGIDLGAWPKLVDYQGRVAARPAVRAVLKAEGLV